MTSALVKHLEDVSQSDQLRATISLLAEETVDESANLEQAAYQRGVEDALTRANATIEQTLAAISENLASLEAQWTTECADRVCREAADGRWMIETRLSAELLAVLSPFVEAAQRERIRESFLQHLREALAASAEISVNLFGPANERKLVVDCLGEMGIAAIQYDRDAPMIEAEIGPRIIRADFASWGRRCLAEFGRTLDVPT